MELKNIYDGKIVLVTGATGLIGSNLVRRLMGFKGIRLIAMGRSMERLECVFARFLARPGFSMVEHDINRPLPRSLGRVDHVFHAASPISGQTIKDKPVSVIMANLTGARNCLEYLVEQQAGQGVTGTMVVFSSATVYGHPAANEDMTFCERDTDSACALDAVEAPYSEAKRMTEVMAQAYGKQFGIDIRIVRFGYVYGPCPFPPKTAFYEFVETARRGENLVFRGTGFPRRDNVFVDDATAGLLCVCEKGKPGDVYNVSSNAELGNFAAIDEMVQALARAATDQGVRVVIAPNTCRASGVRLDNAKLKSLGWRVETSLEDGIRLTYQSLNQD